MRKGIAQSIALGGVLAGLSVVIMSMGTLIPVATYVCPMLCMILCAIVCKLCGKRIAWAWYGAVTVLSLLLSADKESAALYAIIGYYPIIRPFFQKFRLGAVLKLAYFNVVILALYSILFHLLGMQQLQQEYRSLGTWGLACMLLLGNVTFYLFDRVLQRLEQRKR